MYTVEIFFTHFAIWVEISPLGGGAHKISVQKQVRTAAQGLVLIFAKVCIKGGVVRHLSTTVLIQTVVLFSYKSKKTISFMNNLC